ncbi:ABC transporter ATP-binding protein [Neobacillus sp. MM2021_6]|uniref:ABC transporter ATP-binding protein n=1 Tax=Bacillaceae TaxID=186817 RepID=UPI00140C3265|nr:MULTISPECIES: ABC transporter ATP-binding protein [Bacillaceae]MBO0959058.1 ABC transporter ATP-binding protein [Neobacillus sp. MM2021_6]NHC17788.1 ABC transporter ATP-binding protein [Bacillus sp. MM2020_4]
MITIKNVSKVFKQKTALHSFSLTAEDGECIVLCGGNGAGKSTLLQIIAGISPPGVGTVLINQVDIKENRKQYVSLIGYMPDEFFAQESLSVIEFLTFYGTFRKVAQPRIMEVIDTLGLEAKRDEMIKHLSKGMRQRLLFGQAWLAAPAVLILDEPTNGLDPYWIDVFIELLKKIKQSGTTIIFSTHMMDVAAEVADQVIFMENGRMIEAIRNDHVNTKQFMVDLLNRYRK